MVIDKKVAVYTGTKNLYRMMIPAVKSMIANSDVDEIWLFIEDDKFLNGYEFPTDIVKFRNVKDQKYFGPDGPNMTTEFTYMALMRAALAKEFPEYDRILSLDVDTIVNRDISKLWEMPLKNKYYFAACQEPSATEKHGYLYTNIGVALYNLRKLRDGKTDEVIETLNEKYYRYVDQDAFNELCQDHILELDPTYNSNPFTKVVDNPCIVHFAGQKKWEHMNIVKQYCQLSWKEILKFRERNYGK